MMRYRALCACLLALVVTAAVAQEARIGYIDTRRIERESVPFVRALETMKKEFAPREQQIIELQKQITADKERFDKEREKLPAAELQSRANALSNAMRKSDQMTLALTEDIERRRREILGKLFSEIRGSGVELPPASPERWPAGASRGSRGARYPAR